MEKYCKNEVRVKKPSNQHIVKYLRDEEREVP